jgi:hypothetical protein
MDKNLKCIICGCFLPITIAGTLYCFAEKYCKDCKEKLEEQKHIIENITPTNARQIYLMNASGTSSIVIDTSSNYF